ncbi:MAG: radical SAM protein [Candidatus Omnitrophota bacterium]|nr:radical SAM protein [Candidatus Omnitrophota bacterium]MDZ4243125.1 radical SAM protein [Candidatus Omnitrophota bacterium]
MIFDDVELGRRYLQRIAGVRDKKVDIGPEIVALDINNSCNLSCRYCWTHAPGNPAHFDKAHFFPWEKFLEIVRDAVDLEVDQLHITGAGEPTLHPSFRDMMRHIEHKPLKVKLFTNATFPLDYCSDVIKCDHVVVDLSAVDRQQYRDVQGKDLFDRVVANIERLVSLRDAGKPEFLIEIVYIVNEMNVHQKQQMRDLASRLGVRQIYFKRMNVHAYNRDIALPDDPGADPEGEQKRTPPACLNGWFYLIATSNRNTSSCCRIPEMNLGELDRRSLKDIWLSPRMMNMRLLGKYGHIQKMYKACATCPFYDQNIRRAEASAEANIRG